MRFRTDNQLFLNRFHSLYHGLIPRRYTLLNR